MKNAAASIFFAGAIALALAASPLSAADRLQPGQWEFTTTHPGEKDKNTFKHCVTAVEAASANGDTASARAAAEKSAGARCKVAEYKVQGDSVSYTIACGDVTLRSIMTFHGNTSEGDKFTRRAGGAEEVTHIKAKRLGDCP